MKDKFRAFFSKEEPYYEMNSSQENSQTKKETSLFSRKTSTKKDIKVLEKENESLKKSFIEQTIESAKTRRTIRSFSNAAIDEKVLHQCFEAALNSPASGNIQNYKVIFIRDNDRKKNIGKMALDQVWISDAPVVAVVVRNDTQIFEMFPQYGDRYSLQNVTAFITNFLTLLHSSGLGAAWVEACEEGVLKEYLGISGDKFIDAIIPIGFPLEIPKVEKLTPEDVIFFETYGNKKK